MDEESSFHIEPVSEGEEEHGSRRREKEHDESPKKETTTGSGSHSGEVSKHSLIPMIRSKSFFFKEISGESGAFDR
jgi:hypothetical protein